MLTLLDLAGLEDIGWAVIIANNAPAIDSISDQTISHNQDTLDVVLSVIDVDGDDLTVTAEATAAPSVAYQLDQQYNFYPHPVDEYLNFRGINEKYFKGDSGNFYILPNGEVYQWNGSIAASPLVWHR